MKIKRAAYKALKISNDVNAVRRGKIGRRVARRAAGKVTGKWFRKLFG